MPRASYAEKFYYETLDLSIEMVQNSIITISHDFSKFLIRMFYNRIFELFFSEKLSVL